MERRIIMNNDFELVKGKIEKVEYSLILTEVCGRLYEQSLLIKLDNDELKVSLKLAQSYFNRELLVEGDEVYLLYHDGKVVDIRKV